MIVYIYIYVVPVVCSHRLLLLPRIDLDIVGINKNDTPHRVERAIFASLIGDKYEGHRLVFTDGSKSDVHGCGIGGSYGSQERKGVVAASVNGLHRRSDSIARLLGAIRSMKNTSCAPTLLVFYRSLKTSGLTIIWFIACSWNFMK